MRLAFVLLYFFGLSFSYAQVATYEWKVYTPSSNAIDIAQSKSKIYTAMTNGLYEFNLSDGTTFLWTKANFLSDVNLSCIEYDTLSQTLVIGYQNGNIDLINGNTVYNIPDFYLSDVFGDKKINDIVPVGDFVYLATGIGVLKLDPVKKEIKDSFFLTSNGQSVIDVAFLNDSLFALTSDTIFTAKESDPFLANPSQWAVMSNFPTTTTLNFIFMTAVNNSLYLGYNNPNYGQDTLFKRANGQFLALGDVFLGKEIDRICPIAQGYLFCAEGSVYTIDENDASQGLIYQYNEGEYLEPSAALKAGEDYYIADRQYGLVKARNSYSNQKLTFNGPLKNDFYSMDWKNGQLAIAGGGLAGNQNTYNTTGLHLMQDDKWKIIDASNQPTMQTKTWDVVSTSIDPNDEKHIAFGTYAEKGLLEMTDGATVSATYNNGNSPIEPNLLGSANCNINNLQFDDNSNLWVGQSYVNQPLKVKTSDGTWYSFECGSATKTKRLNDLQIDYNGNKWLSFSQVGLLGYNDNGTISDPSDDVYKLLTSGEGNGNLPSNSVLCAVPDFDNKIWIGTDAGLVVLYNSENVFSGSGSYDAQKILIETGGEVESLLGETIVNDIEIDGANRKWIATDGAGVLLLSADGTEQIFRFDEDNSPLLSNTVIDIEINQDNGEVYFATDNGLISFRSDASFGDSDYKNVLVFPNPVRPNYYGPVTIQGIAYNSDVKITDAGGNVVYETTSNGGTATWNGNTLDGKRAKSGVYLIWTAVKDKDKGSKGVKGRSVGKVVFLNGDK